MLSSNESLYHIQGIFKERGRRDNRERRLIKANGDGDYSRGQGCGLEVPRCHRRLSFTFEQLEKPTLLISACLLGTKDFMVRNLWSPHNFS